MNLNYSMWYVKWFFWNLRVLDRFCKKKSRAYISPSHEKYIHGTNICHFFRTLVLGTTIMFFVVVLYIWAFFVVFILPLILFQVYSILGILGILAFAICGMSLVIAIIFGLMNFGTYVYDKMQNRSNRQDKKPGFFTVMCKYIVSVKQQFCPVIKFEENSDEV